MIHFFDDFLRQIPELRFYIYLFFPRMVLDVKMMVFCNDITFTYGYSILFYGYLTKRFYLVTKSFFPER
ncbi:MAG: hypothetical protein DSY79_12990, partial [Chloroflexi bacterium]